MNPESPTGIWQPQLSSVQCTYELREVLWWGTTWGQKPTQLIFGPECCDDLIIANTQREGILHRRLGKMTVIAVAGGTGALGKTFVERFAQEPDIKLVILSRGEQKTSQGSIDHVKIDYDNVQSMTTELERHDVHTIISTIGLISEETSQSQLNLIEAAENATTTKRFIPSEYSFIQTPDLLSIDPSIQFWLHAAGRLKASSLQYTRVIPGFFMDYWGMPHARTHLQPFKFGIDITGAEALIPGDGNDTICMTYTYDLAEYMIHLLKLDEWPEFSIFVGDETTYNEMLEIAKEVQTGKTWLIAYDSIEMIDSGHVTVPDMSDSTMSQKELQEMTALVSRLTVNGVFDLPKDNRMSDRFPQVRPMKVKKFLRQCWGPRPETKL
ncbi:Uncharacterized protein PECH_002406 [Penicillium ucsense]|uniref:NmrA-like domain-containing protein n=1 Tax=Penicillium ucsense TaxID=2839758 RepID=A0A8J8W4L8_9EURO|nr:Uncharacterized protein PECM_003035 [Penicillium ucsense]KAF7737942.1 Uncharacterized protein PECH_002406 [Penicillium ucsense]